MTDAKILQGDCIATLKTMPDASVHCCVTSPPYWGLRDYGHPGQIGLEDTTEAYVARMVEVFREVRRVLRDDGTLWLNLGDSYAANKSERSRSQSGECERPCAKATNLPAMSLPPGLKPKDLVGIPWRVAFALQADGWYLRQDIIWHKPNPMPESVTDRCTKAHEYMFLLSKSARYFYDAEAVKEARLTENCAPVGPSSDAKKAVGAGASPRGGTGQFERDNRASSNCIPFSPTRNRRSVWTIATKPYNGAHFAVMPSDLVEPCILAGTSQKGCCAKCGAPWERVIHRTPATSKKCPKTDAMYQDQGGTGEKQTGTIGMSGGGRINGTSTTTGWQPTCTCNANHIPCTVLDPFAGSGTVLSVATSLGRNSLGCELNPDYIQLAYQRINATHPPLPL